MTRTFFPLPDVIDPPDTLFICLPIPDEAGHRRAFLGSLLNLAQWTGWERDPDHLGTQVAEVWKAVYQSAYEQMEGI